MTSFNIDQWLSGEEETRVVRAMEDAYDEAMDALTEDPMRAALRAALSLTTTEPCKKCGGSGELTATGFDASGNTKYVGQRPCPYCKGGTVPGEPAMTAASTPREVIAKALEQRGMAAGELALIDAESILFHLAEAGMDVARLELEGWRNPAPSGWGYDDFWPRDNDPEMPPPDDWFALYRKLEPQEGGDSEEQAK